MVGLDKHIGLQCVLYLPSGGDQEILRNQSIFAYVARVDAKRRGRVAGGAALPMVHSKLLGGYECLAQPGEIF